MAKFSRSKGRREEQQLVLALAKWGWKAERILRQYQEAGQPDVKAQKGENQYTFEMKSRKCSFKAIYEMYYADRDQATGVLAFVTHSNGPAVAMSTDLASIDKGGYVFRNLVLFPPDKNRVRSYNRTVAFKVLKQSADFLVIKDDRKARLYIRYWG